MKKDEPVLDHTRLNMPSDEMKLGAISHNIKKMHTGNLHNTLEESDFHMLDAYAVMDSERRIAEQAFARELGRPEPYVDDLWSTREELKSQLVENYQEYGVASGPKHAEELVRSIERQAAAQAKEHSRGR